MSTETGQFRSLARIAVALLCAAGFVAMLLVLGGSDRDGAKALYVAIALAVFSLTGAAGVRLVMRGPEVITYLFGYLTVAISVVAFGEVVSAFWSADWLFGDNGKTAAELTLGAVGAANVALLLSTERDGDGVEVHAARFGAVLSVILLTVLALVETSESGQDIGVKPMALFAVLYVLCAALIPLLRWAAFDEG